MPKFSEQITIDAPIERVWAVLAAFGRDLADRAAAEGSQRVVEWVEGEGYTLVLGNVGHFRSFRLRWALRAAGDKTIAAGSTDFKTNAGPLIDHLVWRRRLAGQMRWFLARLRGTVETGGEDGGPVILVEARVSPLSFSRWFCHPRVVIDEAVHHVAWGTHPFPVSPGSHTVEVFFKYLIMEKCGRAMVAVTVPEGAARRLEYSAPSLFSSFLAKGTVEGVFLVAGEPQIQEERIAEPQIQHDLFASTLEITSGRVRSLAQVAPGRVRCTIVFGLQATAGGRPPKEPEHFLDALRAALLDQQGLEDVSIGAMARGQVDIEVTVEAASKQEAVENAELALAVPLLAAQSSLKEAT